MYAHIYASTMELSFCIGELRNVSDENGCAGKEEWDLNLNERGGNEEGRNSAMYHR